MSCGNEICYCPLCCFCTRTQYLNHHSNNKFIVLEQMENVYYNDTLIMDITLLYLNYQDILIDCHGKLQLIHLWFN